MDKIEEFEEFRKKNISTYENNNELIDASRLFTNESIKSQYSYNFSHLGIPIIQYPQDIIAMQEIIWSVKPDLIIETGIAHGGSLIFSASMLALLEYCDAVENREMLDPNKPLRRVLGIDIDIRAHNRAEIEKHPMSNRIEMILGSSISSDVIERVHKKASEFQRILVCLDSNHTHEHVLAELEAYASLVSLDSYCVVFDTIIEDLPDDMFPERPWNRRDNPKTAAYEYLNNHPEFEIDKDIQNKLLITVAPDGYLKRVC